ncbi:MAG TPA: HPr family phosphocarrier protein [bacterium]|nr:HPr family phosphocarrier protein [bacterium]
MIDKSYSLKNSLGMHVRPAGMLVELLSRYKSEVKIVYKSEEVDARSVLAILQLGAGRGEELLFVISGEDEQDVISGLDDLILKRTFDEI